MPSWEQEVPGHILLGAAAPVTRCPHSRRRQPNQRHCPTGGIGCLREPPLPPGLGALTWVTNPLPPAEHTPLPCLEPRPGSRSKQRAGPCCPLDPQPGRLRQEGCRGGHGPSARRAAPPASACPPPPNAGREGDDLSPPGWTLRVRRGPGARAGLGSSHPTTCGPWSLALAGHPFRGSMRCLWLWVLPQSTGRGVPPRAGGAQTEGSSCPDTALGAPGNREGDGGGPGAGEPVTGVGRPGCSPPTSAPSTLTPPRDTQNPARAPPAPPPGEGRLVSGQRRLPRPAWPWAHAGHSSGLLGHWPGQQFGPSQPTWR